MPDKDKIREISKRLMELAPWPGWGDEATVASVARYLAVNAQMAFAMHITPFSGTDGEGQLDPDVIARINAQFAAAHALYALQETDPARAADVAKEIAVAWNDGNGVGEWLWDHMGPAMSGEVARLAEESLAARAMPPKAADAETKDAPPFTGHEGRECGEHRTLGERAWCRDCQDYCYPAIGQACRGCRIPRLERELGAARAEAASARTAAAALRREVAGYRDTATAIAAWADANLPGEYRTPLLALMTGELS